MMRKNRLIAMMLMLVLTGSLMTGCGSKEADYVSSSPTSDSYESDYGFDSYGTEAGIAYEEAAEESYAVESKSASGDIADEVANDTAATESSASTTKNLSQKIIKRYDYRYETERFDDAYAYLKSQIETYGGYIASSDISEGGYSSGYRTLYMTARIPAEQSEAFVSELGQLGTIVRQSESAEDVTLQYSDTESRIEALEIERDRLNDLLEQADSLETIIALEERLTEVRYELDDGTFFSRITTGLERSLRNIGEGFVGFVEWFIIHLPYFVVWAIIIFIIVKIVRTICKKNKEKKMKKQQMKQEQMLKEQQLRQEATKTPSVDAVISDKETK